MSNDDNNSLKSNIFDDDIKLSPINKDDDENSNSSFSLSQKNCPLFISNENFINYFMHIDYNTPLSNNIEDIKDNSNSNLPRVSPIGSSQKKSRVKISEESQKKVKKVKQKEFGILFDSETGISYNEEEDPINYRKAKKRIQNRESALRMKKMRETMNSKLEEELCHLRDDNVRLINENISLKKEKEFLIDQIKFMQKIIKESNLEFKLKNEHSFDSSDNNINTVTKGNEKEKNVFYYNGSKQKIKGNIFNVFVICTLSILYIVGECGFNIPQNNNGQNSNLRSGNSIKLNSIKEQFPSTSSFWFYFSKIILLAILILFIPLFKEAGNLFKDVFRKFRIRNYFNRNKYH